RQSTSVGQFQELVHEVCVRRDRAGKGRGIRQRVNCKQSNASIETCGELLGALQYCPCRRRFGISDHKLDFTRKRVAGQIGRIDLKFSVELHGLTCSKRKSRSIRKL